MESCAIDGLVVRVRNMGNDRYLSVITARLGRITVLSKGSHSLHGEQRAISQLFTYANFEIYRRGELWILRGGSVNHSFHSLSYDIDRMNLAAYFCEVGAELTDAGEDASEMLRLLLNSFYAIDQERYPTAIVKGAFELRAAFSSGYAPMLEGCAECGESGEAVEYLDVMNGALLCSACLQKASKVPHAPTSYDEIREARIILRITPAVHAALCYVAGTSLTRLFSFDLRGEEDLRLFADAAETYLLSHLGHGFETLNFYHTMRQGAKGTPK